MMQHSFKTIWAILALLTLGLTPKLSWAQEQTTVSAVQVFDIDTTGLLIHSKKAKNPKIASWLSVIPGAGQVYNDKAWKVPIIYGAFATTSYLIYDFNKEYKFYRSLYFEASDQSDTYGMERAKQGMEYYARYRDINYIVSVVIYILNIVDASVDAHLSDFDVSDDISMHIAPATFRVGETYAYGLTYKLSF